MPVLCSLHAALEAQPINDAPASLDNRGDMSLIREGGQGPNSTAIALACFVVAFALGAFFLQLAYLGRMLAPLLVLGTIVVVNTVYCLRYLGIRWRISIAKGLGESWVTVLAFTVFVR